MGEASHVFEGNSVLLVLELRPDELRPFSCMVTAPSGASYQASPAKLTATFVPVRSTDFAVLYPDEFSTPPLKAGGRYHVEWRSGGARRALLGADDFEVPVAEREADRARHQLTIGLRYHPDGVLDVLWSYPYSQQHAIPQQTKTLRPNEISADLREALETIVQRLLQRLGAAPVHIPHREVTPTVSREVMDVVVQDQSLRVAESPTAWMVCVEEIPEVEATTRRLVRVTKSDLTGDESAAADLLRQRAKAIAWADYEQRFPRNNDPDR